MKRFPDALLGAERSRGWSDFVPWVLLLFALLAGREVLGDSPSGDPAALRPVLEEGKDFGRGQLEQVQDAARAIPSEHRVPGYQGANPPEGDFYEQNLGLQDTARRRLPHSPAGSFTRDAALRRPHFKLDAATDPLLRRGRGFQGDPAAQLGAPESPYAECQARRLEDTQSFVERRCTHWGASEQSCERTLEPRCLRRRRCPENRAGVELRDLASDMRWTYSYPVLTLGTIANNYWVAACASYERRTTFAIANLERIAEFRMVALGWDDHMRIVLNGNQVFIGPYQGSRLQISNSLVDYGGHRYACEQNTSWKRDLLEIDLKPYLREGENVLDMQVIVSGGGEGWIQIRATQYCACEEWEERWTGDCDELLQAAAQRHCLQSERSCLERGVRRVAGEDLARSCWRERLHYFCDSNSSFVAEGYCAALRERGCSQIDSVCVDRDGQGRCIEYEQRYRCPESGRAVASVLDCGGRPYCLSGDCFATSYSPSGDFGVAASHLAAVEQAARDFDPEKLLIFQGRGRKCKKSAVGFVNCCKDSGWGVDLGLARCSEEERLLAEARRGGHCHYVGSYKRGALLLKRRYQGYCCFRSKLARIIQEQGRAQLGWDWGTARQPQCVGLSPAQLSSLDFEAMDFSDFYQDALRAAQGAVRPGGAAMQSLLERRIREGLRH